MMKLRYLWIFALALLCSSQKLFACPQLVAGLLDFTCDGKQKFIITGDSIVDGLGDTQLGNQGGYVTRLEGRLPGVRFVNLGTTHITTGQLLRRFQSGEYDRSLNKSDAVFIDLGRNDCRDSIPALQAVRNIKRLVRYVRNHPKAETNGTPFVVVATQIPIRRANRKKCVEEINQILIQKAGERLPAYLRFDTLSPHILSHDEVHPNSQGYASMAKFASRFIKNQLQERMQTELNMPAAE